VSGIDQLCCLVRRRGIHLHGKKKDEFENKDRLQPGGKTHRARTTQNMGIRGGSVRRTSFGGDRKRLCPFRVMFALKRKVCPNGEGKNMRRGQKLSNALIILSAFNSLLSLKPDPCQGERTSERGDLSRGVSL